MKIVSAAPLLFIEAILAMPPPQGFSISEPQPLTHELAERVGVQGEAAARGYASVQLIAFEAFTFPGDKLAGCDEDDAARELYRDQCYLGKDDVAKDAAERVAFMKRAVDQASSSAVKSSSILKVFIAPEFFFRGKRGAYRVSDLLSTSPKANIANPLYDYVATDAFKDWLFVFGTVIAASAPDSQYRPDKATGMWAFYNFAPVVKGGSDAKGWLLFKNYLSHIDFLKIRDDDGELRDPYAQAVYTKEGFGGRELPAYAPIPQAVMDAIDTSRW